MWWCISYRGSFAIVVLSSDCGRIYGGSGEDEMFEIDVSVERFDVVVVGVN
jgi:hypothetical protein